MSKKYLVHESFQASKVSRTEDVIRNQKSNKQRATIMHLPEKKPMLMDLTVSTEEQENLLTEHPAREPTPINQQMPTEEYIDLLKNPPDFESYKSTQVWNSLQILDKVHFIEKVMALTNAGVQVDLDSILKYFTRPEIKLEHYQSRTNDLKVLQIIEEFSTKSILEQSILISILDYLFEE